LEKEQLRAKLENFWYYYKWYVLGGVLLLLTLIVGVRSCSLKTKPDLYVLFAVDKSPNALLVAETEQWLGSMVEDTNGDGEATAKLLSVSTVDQWNGYNSAAMMVQVNSGQAVLYILTDKTYATLHENGVLQQLSGESPYLEGDRYCLTASGVLEEVPAFTKEEQNYYLCIRKVDGTTVGKKTEYKTQERLAKGVLQQLIEKE
jgi:hypothetical protein